MRARSERANCSAPGSAACSVFKNHSSDYLRTRHCIPLGPQLNILAKCEGDWINGSWDMRRTVINAYSTSTTIPHFIVGLCFYSASKIPTDLANVLLLPLVPPQGWHLYFLVKCLDNYQMGCHKICYIYDLWTHCYNIGVHLVPLSGQIPTPVIRLMSKYLQNEWHHGFKLRWLTC